MNFSLLRGAVFAMTACVSLIWTTTSKGAAANLSSARKSGDMDRVEVALDVGGTLKMVGENGIEKLKMSASGTAKYHEKLFQRATPEWDRLRVVREYEEARATIQVNEHTTTPALRKERASIVVAGHEKGLQLFGVDGPLSRDELDLIELPCNTAILDELLPGKEVSAGQTWEHSAELTAALLGLDAAGVSDLKSKMIKVEGNAATVEMNGEVQGAIKGVTTKIEVKARYKFDLKSKRITWLGLLLKEDRSIGHVGPGMEITAKLQITIQPGAKQEKLAAMTDAESLKELAPEYAMLEYEPPKGYYRLLYDRRWHVMTDEPNLVSMRMIDRGELLAQAKVSTPAGTSHNATPTIQAFQQEIQKSLDDEFGEFVESTTTQNSLGVITHRVVVRGVVSELPIEWRYYLLVGPDGRQVVVAFTLEETLAERFGTSDEELVDYLEFTALTPGETARKVRLKVPAASETAQGVRLKLR